MTDRIGFIGLGIMGRGMASKLIEAGHELVIWNRTSDKCAPLVEKGVRFVQAYAGNWDSHDYIARAHGSLIRSVDKPIAGLLADLKERGMLDDTLVVWCGEFGRTPDNGLRGGGQSYGRDHNAKAMTMWFAGGGCNAGNTIGATDEIGATAVEEVHHIRDVHVTLLRLLGLDDNKLTFYHAGRFKQLSQFGGNVIDGIVG